MHDGYHKTKSGKSSAMASKNYEYEYEYIFTAALADIVLKPEQLGPFSARKFLERKTSTVFRT
jgi:hypothetical protein